MKLLKNIRKISALTAAATSVMMSAATATELTVYTSVEADSFKKYVSAFNELHPDIKLNWIRDSAGIQTARLLAEKENPQADFSDLKMRINYKSFEGVLKEALVSFFSN